MVKKGLGMIFMKKIYQKLIKNNHHFNKKIRPILRKGTQYYCYNL